MRALLFCLLLLACQDPLDCPAQPVAVQVVSLTTSSIVAPLPAPLPLCPLDWPAAERCGRAFAEQQAAQTSAAMCAMFYDRNHMDASDGRCNTGIPELSSECAWWWQALDTWLIIEGVGTRIGELEADKAALRRELASRAVRQ